MKNRRVFLKLSGEALAGPKKTGFDEDTVKEVARQVKASVDAGVQVGVVIGGGNFWRGRKRRDRPSEGRPDRNACDCHELYLCIRDLPERGNEDTDPYPV
mgnify:CR=1 FL=1